MKIKVEIKILGKLFLEKKKTNKQKTKQKQNNETKTQQTTKTKSNFKIKKFLPLHSNFAVIEYYFLSYFIFSCLLFAKC